MPETTTDTPRHDGGRGTVGSISLTSLLIAANVLVFLWMAWKGVSPRHPSVERIRELGANFGPYTLGGQPWRLLTSNYIHFGWAHLLTNMISLWGLGRLMEVFYPRRDYLLLYTFSGICGSLLSVYMNPMVVGAGASGAVFGLAGALLSTLRWGKLPISTEARRSVYKQVLEFAGLNLLLGFGLSLFVHIDNFGHMGGLIGGGIAGLVLGRHLDRSPQSATFRRAAWLVMIVLTTMVALAVIRARGFVVDLYAAQQDLARNKYDAALTHLDKVTRKRPDLGEPYMMSGQAWMAKRDYSRAAASFGKAADVSPQSARPLVMMVNAHQMAGELPQAEVASRRIAQLFPNDPDSHFLLSVVLLEERKFSEAETSLRRAIELDPRPKPQYWVTLGNVLLASNRPADAIPEYEKAVQLSPDNVMAIRGLFNAHSKLGNKVAADHYAQVMQKVLREKEAASANPAAKR